jgi:hypothetical protein
MNLLELINYCSVEEIKLETDKELVLDSRRKKVFNPVFVVGCILFIGGMFLKAHINSDWAAIPLAIATLILFTGVWILSANAKLVFDCYEQKVFRIYSHLGYLRKIYVAPLLSIERFVLKEENGINKLYLIRDNGQEILVSNIKTLTKENAEEICGRVNGFIGRNK